MRQDRLSKDPLRVHRALGLQLWIPESIGLRDSVSGITQFDEEETQVGQKVESR